MARGRGRSADTPRRLASRGRRHARPGCILHYHSLLDYFRRPADRGISFLRQLCSLAGADYFTAGVRPNGASPALQAGRLPSSATARELAPGLRRRRAHSGRVRAQPGQESARVGEHGARELEVGGIAEGEAEQLAQRLGGANVEL